EEAESGIVVDRAATGPRRHAVRTGEVVFRRAGSSDQRRCRTACREGSGCENGSATTSRGAQGAKGIAEKNGKAERAGGQTLRPGFRSGAFARAVHIGRPPAQAHATRLAAGAG